MLGPEAAEMSPAQPSVVIVDDHAIFRAGVRCRARGPRRRLADVGSVEEAVRSITELNPDVVLLDVHMPGGGGVEVIRKVAESRPAQRFLALSVSDAAEDVIAVVRAGARGYVTKSISGPELADAVRRVRDGDAVFSPRLAGFVLDAFAGEIPEEQIDPELDQLTMREREVLRLIARGYLYKEVALRALDLDQDRRGPRLARSCGSSSSPTATSSAAGRSSAGWSTDQT